MTNHNVTVETELLGAIVVTVTHRRDSWSKPVTCIKCYKPDNMSMEEYEYRSMQIGSWSPGHKDPYEAAKLHLNNYLGIK